MSEPKGNLSPPQPAPKAASGQSSYWQGRQGFAALIFIAVSIFALIVAAGGAWTGSPDVSQGMQWVNADDAWTSSFYVLRDGSHLVVESNKRAELLTVGFVSLLLTFIGYCCWMAAMGQLTSKFGQPIRRPLQYPVAGLMLLVGGWLSYTQIGGFIHGRSLDLDPSADRVTLDGSELGRFQEVDRFVSYTTHGSKGGVNYHLEVGVAGQFINIDAVRMGSDTEELASFLNRYLAEVRAKP